MTVAPTPRAPTPVQSKAAKHRCRRRARLLSATTQPAKGDDALTVPRSATDFALRMADPSAQRRLTQVIRSAGYDPAALIQLVTQLADQSPEDGGSHDKVAFAFACSLLVDLTQWGATVEVIRSQVWVTMPRMDATADDGDRVRIRQAMVRLRGTSPRYVAPITPSEGFSILRASDFELRPALPGSPEGDVFRTGVTTWSMPYRTREGRSKRFVLLARSNPGVVPVGLLEIGDDAPHNPLRDKYAGLNLDAYALTDHDPSSLADRFRDMRMALLPAGLPAGWDQECSALLPRLPQLRLRGRGRDGDAKEVSQKKKLTYLARLVAAEAALKGLRGTSASDVREGLRAFRDVALPRIHTEMAICGALPPFGPLLAGKLVASMACHPYVRRELDRPFGQITSGLFNTEKLERLVPRHGALIVTTKGLYPGHSAQYSGVRIPGRAERPLRLDKLGDTSGQTSSHISDRTMRLAMLITNEASKAVSRLYGSGGAKRQRTLEQAALIVGLPSAIVHAQISRPVYGVALCSNVGEVVLTGAAPSWLGSPYSDQTVEGAYEGAAADLWREKWLSVAERRLLKASINQGGLQVV